mmetsp:Transcript_1861/g.3528  ORF Transcript_1861/g.3528 Transcript_1861/m.3528 type:complete len:222 (+) Transcript_1861:1147-1812(+)
MPSPSVCDRSLLFSLLLSAPLPPLPSDILFCSRTSCAIVSSLSRSYMSTSSCLLSRKLPSENFRVAAEKSARSNAGWPCEAEGPQSSQMFSSSFSSSYLPLPLPLPRESLCVRIWSEAAFQILMTSSGSMGTNDTGSRQSSEITSVYCSISGNTRVGLRKAMISSLVNRSTFFLELSVDAAAGDSCLVEVHCGASRRDFVEATSVQAVLSVVTVSDCVVET